MRRKFGFDHFQGPLVDPDLFASTVIAGRVGRRFGKVLQLFVLRGTPHRGGASRGPAIRRNDDIRSPTCHPKVRQEGVS